MTRFAFDTGADGFPVSGTVHKWVDNDDNPFGRWVRCRDQAAACSYVAHISSQLDHARNRRGDAA